MVFTTNSTPKWVFSPGRLNTKKGTLYPLKSFFFSKLQIVKDFSFSISYLKLETKSQPFPQGASLFPVKDNGFLNLIVCTNNTLSYVIIFIVHYSEMYEISNLFSCVYVCIFHPITCWLRCKVTVAIFDILFIYILMCKNLLYTLTCFFKMLE